MGRHGGGWRGFRRVSIPFKREGAWKDSVREIMVYVARIEFQFPSNGKEHGKAPCVDSIILCRPTFQFPSNGKEHGKRPYFRPRRAVAPNTPKPNTNCAGLFSHEKLPRKSHKPLWPLNQTRFFTKNGLEPKHALCSWAI